MVPDADGPLPFALVGHGWRADFYLRIAAAMPDRFTCTGVVTRGPEAGQMIERRWGVPSYRSIDATLAAGDPAGVVTSVPWAANPDVVREVVAHGVAVLAETPPAPDAEGLRRLWADVGATGLVQVAEQNPYLPVLAAIGRIVDGGALGTVTSAWLSWTHGYHAVAVLRRLLGAGGEPVTVRTSTAEGLLVQGPGRSGRPAAPAEIGARHTVATLEFPTGIGTYDFTHGQWFHPLRRRHLVVRGSRGEIVGTSVVWSDDDGRPLEAPLMRRQTGQDGDLEGAGSTPSPGRVARSMPTRTEGRGSRTRRSPSRPCSNGRSAEARDGAKRRIPWRRPARTTCSPSRSTRPAPRGGP